MRWSELFDDLEAQLMHAEREAFEDEVRERATAERAAISLGSVLAASEGARVRVTLAGGERLEGVVRDAAAQWILVGEGAREWLIPVGAITALDGVEPGAGEPGLVASRLTLGHALRALAEDHTAVVVATRGSNARGRITAVGADYLVVEGTVVPFAAILTVAPAPA